MEDNFSIINRTRGKIPILPFSLIKKDILGKNYCLSLVFVSKNIIQKLNNQYRNKNQPTDILSFPLTKTEGEILICPTIVKKEIKKFNKNYSQLIQFLVIHGMLHLKGMEHSSRMEKREQFYDKKYFNWHRYRIG